MDISFVAVCTVWMWSSATGKCRLFGNVVDESNKRLCRDCVSGTRTSYRGSNHHHVYNTIQHWSMCIASKSMGSLNSSHVYDHGVWSTWCIGCGMLNWSMQRKQLINVAGCKEAWCCCRFGEGSCFMREWRRIWCEILGIRKGYSCTCRILYHKQLWRVLWSLRCNQRCFILCVF